MKMHEVNVFDPQMEVHTKCIWELIGRYKQSYFLSKWWYYHWCVVAIRFESHLEATAIQTNVLITTLLNLLHLYLLDDTQGTDYS